MADPGFKSQVGETYLKNSTVRVNFIDKNKKIHLVRGDVMSLTLKYAYLYINKSLTKKTRSKCNATQKLNYFNLKLYPTRLRNLKFLNYLFIIDTISKLSFNVENHAISKEFISYGASKSILNNSHT